MYIYKCVCRCKSQEGHLQHWRQLSLEDTGTETGAGTGGRVVPNGVGLFLFLYSLIFFLT